MPRLAGEKKRRQSPPVGRSGASCRRRVSKARAAGTPAFDSGPPGAPAAPPLELRAAALRGVKWEKGASFVRHWVRGDRLTRTLHWRNLVALTTVCTVNGKVDLPRFRGRVDI